MTCVKFKLMFKVTKSGAMSPCLCRIKQTQITFLNPQHQTLVAVGLGNTPLESYLCYLGRGSWIFWAVRSSSSFAEFHFDVYACRLPSLLRDDRWCLLVTCKKSQNNEALTKITVIIKNSLKKWILLNFCDTIWLVAGISLQTFVILRYELHIMSVNMSWMRLNCDTFAPISIQTRDIIGLSLYIICFKIQIELDWLVTLL